MAYYDFKCDKCGHVFSLEKNMLSEFKEEELKCPNPDCADGKGMRVWAATPMHGLITRKGV